MDSREFCGRLIVGSDNINKMRKVIEQTVSLVMGYVPLCHHYPLHIQRIVEVDDCVWLVRSNTENRSVICRRKKIGAPSFEDIYFQWENRETVLLYGKNVQFVYQNLHLFVEAVIQGWPTLAEASQWLIDASQVEVS